MSDEPSGEGIFGEGSQGGDTPTEPAVNTPPEPEAAAGDRPNWLPEKFATAEDLAKGYRALETRLSQGGIAPDAYDLTLPDGLDGLGESLYGQFRDANLSNIQAQGVVDLIAKDLLPELTRARNDVEELTLRDAWGLSPKEAKDHFKFIKTWAEGHYEGQPHMLKHLGSASGILYLESEMKREASNGRVDPLVDSARPETKNESFARMLKDPRINPASDQYDADFHAKVRNLALQATD